MNRSSFCSRPISGVVFLALLLFASRQGMAQCANPPSCIINNELGAPAPSGDMNSTPGDMVNGWSVMHGTPTLFGNDCPTSANGCSIWMWTYSGSGEGVFTCFNFLQGQTYELCLWVRNTNNVSNGGHLMIYAANNIAGNGFTPPPISGPNLQVIDTSFTNNQTWTQLTFLFTPTQNFNQLLLYPLMRNPPVGGQFQYELQIDDVRITAATGVPPQTITASTLTPQWCEPVTLCLDSVPPGASILWQPSAGLTDSTSTCITVDPCATTTYTAIVGLLSSCPSCSSLPSFDSVSVQVVVAPPQLTINTTLPANCGDPVRASALVGPTSCSNVSLSWQDAAGNTFTGDTVLLPSSANTSSYTLTATSPGGCSTSQSVNISPGGAAELALFVPNAFTPGNGDNRNDFFTAYSPGFSAFRLQIYNRWGERIFETQDPNTGWNGRVGGTLVQEDVYVYVLDYSPECTAQQLRRTGRVSVIR